MATWPAKTDYATGDVLSATNMNDIGNGLNDLYGESFTNNFYAGKNKIINGDFGIWQRGTSFTLAASTDTYTADRFVAVYDGSGATCTVSQQTFTAGTAPVSGYEGTYFLRWNRSAAGSSNTLNYLQQRIEDVRTYAGQTVTLSFWAKADTARTLTLQAYQEFGTGGSSAVNVLTGTASVTTSWARYTVTATIPSIAGKTIGTNSKLNVYFIMPTATAFTFDYWGVQLEAGSTATPFQTATGTKQGELAACQRYYYRAGAGNVYGNYSSGIAYSTTNAYSPIKLPVTMRTIPATLDYSTLALFDGVTFTAVSSMTLSSNQNTPDTALVIPAVASGLTQYRPYFLVNNNNTAGYVGLSAEL